LTRLTLHDIDKVVGLTHLRIPERLQSSEMIVENFVGLLEEFVEQSSKLEEACIAFNCYFLAAKMQPERLMFLKHEKVRRWSSNIRINVGSVDVLEGVFNDFDH